jgi:hypothetical protein
MDTNTNVAELDLLGRLNGTIGAVTPQLDYVETVWKGYLLIRPLCS